MLTKNSTALNISDCGLFFGGCACAAMVLFKYWTVLVPKTQLNQIYFYLIVTEIFVN